jgi:hypothetical protein
MGDTRCVWAENIQLPLQRCHLSLGVTKESTVCSEYIPKLGSIDD